MSSVPHFDTLHYVETLTTAGAPEPVAKASAAALGTALQQWGSGFLATKGDIFELKSEIAALRAELKSDMAALSAELKSDMAALSSELKSDMAALRSELKSDMAALRSEMKSDMDALRTELKNDMGALRAELKGQIAATHAELKGDITALRVDQADIRSELKLVKWMSATSVACVLMLLVRSFL